MSKYKVFEVGFVILTLIVTLMTLANYDSTINDVYYALLIPVLAFLILSFFRKFDILSVVLLKHKTTYLIPLFFAILYFLMAPISSILSMQCLKFQQQSVRQYFLLPFNYLYIVLSFIDIFWLVCFLLHLSFKNDKQLPCKRTIFSCKTTLICFFFISLAAVLMAIAGYPGILGYDSQYVWERKDDWHCWGFVLLTKVLFGLFNHPFAFVIFMALFYIVTNIFVLDTIYKTKSAKACVLYTILLLTLGIEVMKFIIVLYKDGPHAIALLGFFTALYRAQQDKKKFSWFMLGIYGGLAAIWRHATIIFIIFGVLCLLIYYLLKNRKVLLRLVIFTIIPIEIIVGGTFVSTLYVQDFGTNPSYVAYTLPLYMLGVYAASGYEIPESTIVTMEKIMPVEEWAIAYNIDSYWADPCSRSYDYVGNRINEFDKQQMQNEVIQANWQFFLAHPQYYCAHILKPTNIAWSISKPPDCCDHSIIGLDEVFEESYTNFPEWYQQDQNQNIVKIILTPVVDILENYGLIKLITRRSGLSMWLIFVFFVIAIRRKNLKIILTTLPMLLCFCLWLISLPSTDVRYVFPALVFVSLMLPLLFYDDRPQGSLLKN